MADGSGPQHAFNFPAPLPTAIGYALLKPGEMTVDLFAGGGGASEALKQAIGRDPDLAINHNPKALGMHAANHPCTRHMIEDIFEVCPLVATAGRWIGWLHASSDCTHFSQAIGGQPRSKAIRSLSWVLVKWAGKMAAAGRPIRILSLENVEQILKWGPLVAKRDKATGRVVTLDKVPKIDPATGEPILSHGKPVMVHRVAAKGEHVPRWNQFLVPDKKREGQTWRRFIELLYATGAKRIEWRRRWVASDHGAGTLRSRMFMVVRFDDEPIVWPSATHGEAEGLKPLIVAGDSIDFSLPCRSIHNRQRPLAKNSKRRVARGIWRHVINSPNPFIVPLRGTSASHTSTRGVDGPLTAITAGGTHHMMVAPVLTEFANASSQRTWSSGEPLRTQCAQVNGGHFAMATPTLVHLGATLIQTGYGERAGQAPRVPGLLKPLGVVVAGGVKHAVVEALGVQTNAFMLQASGGPNGNQSVGHEMRKPVSTITQTGSHQQLCTAYLVKFYGTGGQWSACNEPIHTIPTKDRMAVIQSVSVPQEVLTNEQWETARLTARFLAEYLPEHFPPIKGESIVILGDYVLVDIGLRMLTPRELFNAQGFPPSYIIDRTADGTKLTKTEQVEMCGNSVSPPALRAIIQANLPMAKEPMAVAA